ncbi:MAG: FtsQ-type POTRA domain-containing protein, partial [Candidatus Omnitrophica bacterium]|nr:FtsQ-type POTRA domain-containing protein [Candidatus Omnitrophota bacterium]
MFRKQHSRKKIKPHTGGEPFLDVFLKQVIPYVMAGIVILVIVLMVRGVFVSLPYFDVHDVKVVAGKEGMENLDFLKNYDLLKTCKGKNIFEVDIRRIETMIRKDHPEFKLIQVNRSMPGTIEIKVVVRIPVVIVRLGDYYPIDTDGVVLSPMTKFKGALPIIGGISISKKPKVGERIESGQLKSVL